MSSYLRLCAAGLCTLLVASALLLSPPAQANEPSAEGPPLGLDEVLQSVKAHHPKVAVAVAKQEKARAERLAATGAFDTRSQAEVYTVPRGNYEYLTASAGLAQPIWGTGIEVEAGYRIGQGNIPDYYGERQTLSGGEVALSARIPLLANRSTDGRRTAIELAELAVTQSDSLQRMTTLELQRNATRAYFEWVAAGLVLHVAEELMIIAETRAATVAAQADKGAIARIETIDASKVLLSRKSSVVKAREDFAKAQTALSLYYRDQEARPLRVGVARVPAQMPALQTPPLAAVAQAMQARPDLQAIDAAIAQASKEQRLAENQQLPKLDLKVFASRDIGVDAANYGGKLGATDVGAAAVFSWPLWRREYRGKEKKARAEVAELRAERRGLRDRIEAEIHQARELIDLQSQKRELAQERLEATRVLATAERRRLEQGASDLLRVNLRELEVAYAATELYETMLALNRLVADLSLALGTEPRLVSQ